jgi:hypothetical protein
MNTRFTSSLLASALVLATAGLCSGALAQNNPSTTNGGSTPVLQVLPRLIKFSGELSPEITEMVQPTPESRESQRPLSRTTPKSVS